MAKTLKDMTRVGTDARKIAALLQAKAPKGHMLAFINDREAALLKSAGGSGHIDPETGIRSFEDTEFEPPPEGEPPPPGTDIAMPMPDYSFAPSMPLEPAQLPAAAPVTPVDITTGAFGAGRAAPPSLPFGGGVGVGPYVEGPAEPGTAAAMAKPLVAPEPGTTGKGLNLGQLGIAGLGALLGARAGRRATAGAQASAQQMQQLAAPYQQTGQQLQAAAQRGELTPGGQQAIQAMQAQLAQGIEARGGVGVAQAQAAIANLRTQLLQQQYDYGLKLSGIGDNIALGAIKTGMEADRYAAQLSQNFYSNLARVAAGAFGGTPTPQ